jgi:hypothetical protein
MKKLILIIALLFVGYVHAQKPRVDYQRWAKYTTEKKLAIDVSDTTVVYQLFDGDLDRYESYNHKVGEWEPILSKDLDAIHKNVAGEVFLLDDKEVPVDDDVLLGEDSEDDFVKKRFKLGALGFLKPSDVPLVAVDEGNGVGYRNRTIDTSHVGNIGSNSIDFGAYGTVSSTAGPTGENNFTAIGTNTIPGVANAAFGSLINITSAYNFSTGYWNYIGGNTTNNGYHFSAGRGNNIGGGLGNMLLGTALSQNTGVGVVVLGTANAEVTATANFSNSNPVLIVGNGTHSTSANTDWNSTAVRKNLLVGYRSGFIVAPSLTKTLIDADTTGRVLVTKEWVLTAIDTISGGGGAVSSVNSQTGDVVIDPDDLDDTSTTNKFVTATEKGLIATALQPSAISNEAYNASTWNGVDTIAPSKNAIRDKLNEIDLTLANIVTTNTSQSISGFKSFTGGITIVGDGSSGLDQISFSGNTPGNIPSTSPGIRRVSDKLAFMFNQNIGGQRSALFDGSAITDSDKTFTFPNKSGTIALLDDISGGGSGEATDISVDTSEFVNNLTVADSTVQKALETLDGLSIGVNTAFRTVTSTSGDFTEEFNAEQPNFQLHLDEDVTIEITDAVNGDFLIANIVNDDVSEDTFKVTLVGTVNLEFELKHGESTLVTMVTDADDNITWVRSYPKGYKPTSVHDTATIYMDGDSVYDDTTADASTITLSNCDVGETLKVYINRASMPTLAGTDLVFNQLPNTTAFEAATDMVITFIVTPLLSSGDRIIDYYLTER